MFSKKMEGFESIKMKQVFYIIFPSIISLQDDLLLCWKIKYTNVTDIFLWCIISREVLQIKIYD